ncbi:hypothetical protein F4819DRAFT_179626 [Hypoxylon fuscum]|nr:hypothetical protein F4819DRAFT_179626 [Hypoxylon fuscum]
MSLRHIVVPSWPRTKPPKFPTYNLATRLQSRLQQSLLAWKALPKSVQEESAPPSPTLISFTPAPTYTLGRRQTEPLSATELARLKAPLHHSSSPTIGGGDGGEPGSENFIFTPEVLHAPRGGLATYHGPGQVVLWPVIDLRSPLHAHFTVRDYTCLLEKTTIATLRRLYQIEGFTTENPGVWVRLHAEGRGEEEHKISALGVHLRRHVTGLGVAINVQMPVEDAEITNPWRRIVACGLDDKRVTNVENAAARMVDQQQIAPVWAEEFAARLKVHGRGTEPGNAGVEEDAWERWEKELDCVDADYVKGQPD